MNTRYQRNYVIDWVREGGQPPQSRASKLIPREKRGRAKLQPILR